MPYLYRIKRDACKLHLMCLFYTQISARVKYSLYSILTREISIFTTQAARRVSSRGCFGIQSAAKRGGDLAKRIKHPLIIAMLKLFIESWHQRESNPTHNPAHTHTETCSHTHLNSRKICRYAQIHKKCTNDFDSIRKHTGAHTHESSTPSPVIIRWC